MCFIKYQTPRLSPKILRCMSYFQLSSQCLICDETLYLVFDILLDDLPLTVLRQVIQQLQLILKKNRLERDLNALPREYRFDALPAGLHQPSMLGVGQE